MNKCRLFLIAVVLNVVSQEEIDIGKNYNVIGKYANT